MSPSEQLPSTATFNSTLFDRPQPNMDKTSPTGSNRKMTPHREALTFAARPRLRFFEHLVCNLSISAFETAVRISLLALVLGLSQDACASSPSATAGLSVGRASEVGVDPQILNQAAALIRETVAEKEIPGAVIDPSVACFVQMCHALSNKINAKLTRQRTDRQMQMFMELTTNQRPAANEPSKGKRNKRKK